MLILLLLAHLREGLGRPAQDGAEERVVEEREKLLQVLAVVLGQGGEERIGLSRDVYLGSEFDAA